LFLRDDRLDSSQADLAPVSKTKGPRIDGAGDAAFALRIQSAAGGIGRAGCGRQERDCAESDLHPWHA
jgi:hypothetical protein